MEMRRKEMKKTIIIILLTVQAGFSQHIIADLSLSTETAKRTVYDVFASSNSDSIAGENGFILIGKNKSYSIIKVLKETIDIVRANIQTKTVSVDGDNSTITTK